MNVTEFVYEEMRVEHVAEVSRLMYGIYARYIAPDFSPPSRSGMEHYLSEASLISRLGHHHFGLICRVAETGGPTTGWRETVQPIIGVIEVREFRHITLLFVDEDWQRKGIARQLIDRAVARCRINNPTLAQITVRATPYAVPVYSRLGFEPDPARIEPDTPALPMRLNLM